MYWLNVKSSNWVWVMKDLDPIERYHSEDEAKIRIFEIIKKNEDFFNPSDDFSKKYFMKLQLLNI
jgi:hypothetical protein